MAASEVEFLDTIHYAPPNHGSTFGGIDHENTFGGIDDERTFGGIDDERTFGRIDHGTTFGRVELQPRHDESSGTVSTAATQIDSAITVTSSGGSTLVSSPIAFTSSGGSILVSSPNAPKETWEDDVEQGRESTSSSTPFRGPVEERDETDRLRMLGYDAVLGRPLDMWSSGAMSFCHHAWIYEFVILTSMYTYHAPMIFLIGYPIMVIFTLVLMGPFAEMSSAFPTSGAMATWAWQYARVGVGYERQWAWFTGGMTLAMHLGRVIGYLYNLSLGVTQIYIFGKKLPFIWGTWAAAQPQKWWEPTWYLSALALASIVTLTRISRHRYFWYFGFILNIGIFVVLCYLIFSCIPNTKPSTHRGHMAEETKNPSKAVPWAMYVSFILHSLMVYFTMTAFLVIVRPLSVYLGDVSAIGSLIVVLNLNTTVVVAYGTAVMGACVVQILAAVTVTSRFLFALGRDHAIPFSKLLSRTDKNKEPWVAMVVLLVALFLSATCWFVDAGQYFNLITSVRRWYIATAYAAPLFLFATAKVNLAQHARADFSTREWGKPAAWMSLIGCLLSIIQGCFPVTGFGNSVQKDLGSLSAFPFFVVAMFLIMTVTWYLYGRGHYIGPIRALTKWNGDEVDPREFAVRRGNIALMRWIDRRTGHKVPSRRNSSSTFFTSARSPTVPRTYGVFGGPISHTIDLPDSPAVAYTNVDRNMYRPTAVPPKLPQQHFVLQSAPQNRGNFSRPPPPALHVTGEETPHNPLSIPSNGRPSPGHVESAGILDNVGQICSIVSPPHESQIPPEDPAPNASRTHYNDFRTSRAPYEQVEAISDGVASPPTSATGNSLPSGAIDRDLPQGHPMSPRTAWTSLMPQQRPPSSEFELTVFQDYQLYTSETQTHAR